MKNLKIVNRVLKQAKKDNSSIQAEHLIACVVGLVAYKEVKNSRFPEWIEAGSDFDISNITDSMSEFSRLGSPEDKENYGELIEGLWGNTRYLGDLCRTKTRILSRIIWMIHESE